VSADDSQQPESLARLHPPGNEHADRSVDPAMIRSITFPKRQQHLQCGGIPRRGRAGQPAQCSNGKAAPIPDRGLERLELLKIQVFLHEPSLAGFGRAGVASRYPPGEGMEKSAPGSPRPVWTRRTVRVGQRRISS
jgi:hypothetical protein